MDIALILALAASGVSCLGAVLSAWFARRNNVRELENTVDDLAIWAEKAVRSARAQRMREVRGAPRGDDPPPELKNSPEPSGETFNRKAEIRKRARTAGLIH